MKIPESKMSKIRIIVEFRGIPNGFPNLAVGGRVVTRRNNAASYRFLCKKFCLT
jgi:hypothetical protein